MTAADYATLNKGQAIRIRKSGKIYIVVVVDEAQDGGTCNLADTGGPDRVFTYAARPRTLMFHQWRTDRNAYYGPLRYDMSPANIERAPEFDRPLNADGRIAGR